MWVSHSRGLQQSHSGLAGHPQLLIPQQQSVTLLFSSLERAFLPTAGVVCSVGPLGPSCFPPLLRVQIRSSSVILSVAVLASVLALVLPHLAYPSLDKGSSWPCGHPGHSCSTSAASGLLLVSCSVYYGPMGGTSIVSYRSRVFASSNRAFSTSSSKLPSVPMSFLFRSARNPVTNWFTRRVSPIRSA